jgi:AraC-like DNA-binding protein
VSLSYAASYAKPFIAFGRPLYRDNDLLVEDVVLAPEQAISLSAQHPLIVLPYSGIGAYSADSGEMLFDANQALVGMGQTGGATSYQAASSSELRALAISVRTYPFGTIPSGESALFATNADVRLAALTLRRSGGSPQVVSQLVRAVLASPRIKQPTPRIVNITRRMLLEQDGQRCSLAEVARQVGVTPSYLTQEFTRSMGAPLYQYQMQLRMTRALLELPDCLDITALALSLGFSSHSHFSAAFKACFGQTPSTFRDRVSSTSAPQLTY